MTSPNNIINITPPALIDSTMNTDNIISAANNMVNNIIFTNSFHNRKRKNRDFKYNVCQSTSPIVLEAVVSSSKPT